MGSTGLSTGRLLPRLPVVRLVATAVPAFFEIACQRPPLNFIRGSQIGKRTRPVSTRPPAATLYSCLFPFLF